MPAIGVSDVKQIWIDRKPCLSVGSKQAKEGAYKI